MVFIAFFWTVLFSFSSAQAEESSCVHDPAEAAGKVCELYSRYGDTRNSPFASEARACDSYYRSAFRAFNTLCEYQKGAAHAWAGIESTRKKLDEAADSDRSSFEQALASQEAEAAAQFAKNRDELAAAVGFMERAYGAYSKALWVSTDYIYSQWTRELYCKGGYRSEVPGFWLDAINRAMSRQLKNDHPKMTVALMEAIRLSGEGAKGPEGAAEAAKQASKGLDLNLAGPDMAESEEGVDRKHGHEEGQHGENQHGENQHGESHGPHFHKSKKEAAIRTAQELVSEKAIHKIHHFLPLPGWLRHAMNVGSGVAFYSWRDGFDAGTVISASFSVFGIPAGVAATVVEVAIRNDLARRNYFRAWVWPHLKEHPGLTSRQVANDFCHELEKVEERHKAKANEEKAVEEKRQEKRREANAARLKAEFECREKILEAQKKVHQARSEERAAAIREYRRSFSGGRCL